MKKTNDFINLGANESLNINGGFSGALLMPNRHIIRYDDPKDAAGDMLWVAGGAAGGSGGGLKGAALGALGGFIGAVGNSLLNGKARIERMF